MAWRYRMWPIQDDNLLDPYEVWNLPMAEYAEEMNGYLDRDNIGNQWLTDDHIVDDQFHQVLSAGSTTAGNIDRSNSQWTETLSVGAMPRSTFTVSDDTVVEAHLGVQIIQDFDNAVTNLNYTRAVRVRILVDGEEIARSGWVAELHEYSREHIFGVTVVAPGDHEVTSELQIAEIRYAGGEQINQWGNIGDGTATAPQIDTRELVVILSSR